MIRAALIAGLLSVPASAQQAPESAEGVASGVGAIVRGLDKVSGQVLDLELYSGGGRAVMGLEVDLADCRYPMENPTGDAYAYLTIRAAEGAGTLFEGWMIATAPALNALDHSRYDIWVIRCITS